MKKYYALCLFLILFVSMWAVDTNDFLIGAYSQYQIRYAGSNYAANFDSLGVYLNNAGYNATIYSLTSGSENRLSTILQKLHESDIKSMLHDNTWSPGEGRLGVGSTTCPQTRSRSDRFCRSKKITKNTPMISIGMNIEFVS